MAKLSDAALQAKVAGLPHWECRNGALEREFRFRNFVGAIEFVRQTADLAEQAGHHPDIDIRYNRVRLALVTHDEGGITDKDIDMAGRISSLADAQ